MTRTKRRIIEYCDWFALTWSAIIGYLSLSPLSALPEIAASDKLEHFAAYAVLGFLGVILRRSKRDTFWVLFAIVVYGGLIETIQPYVDRFMELGDFIANTCGALFGASLVLISSRVNTWRE